MHLLKQWVIRELTEMIVIIIEGEKGICGSLFNNPQEGIDFPGMNLLIMQNSCKEFSPVQQRGLCKSFTMWYKDSFIGDDPCEKLLV